MASKSEGGIYDDPNFAVICSFITNYAKFLQFPDISFSALRSYIQDTNKVHRLLEDIFIRLLRRWRGRCGVHEWEKVLVKFCHTYSNVDAWELERFGLPRCKLSTKLRIIKNLLESQFDCHSKFKEKLNSMSAEELRLLPIGRDKHGMAYWFFLDKDSNIRIYREEQDDTDQSESWRVVVKDYEGLKTLITSLEEEKNRLSEESRSVTPSISGSRSDTPNILQASRSATPAIEEKEEVKLDIKEESETETKTRSPLKMIIKRERHDDVIKAEMTSAKDVQEKTEVPGDEVDVKPDVKPISELATKKKQEDSDKENSAENSQTPTPKTDRAPTPKSEIAPPQQIVSKVVPLEGISLAEVSEKLKHVAEEYESREDASEQTDHAVPAFRTESSAPVIESKQSLSVGDLVNSASEQIPKKSEGSNDIDNTVDNSSVHKQSDSPAGKISPKSSQELTDNKKTGEKIITEKLVDCSASGKEENSAVMAAESSVHCEKVAGTVEEKSLGNGLSAEAVDSSKDVSCAVSKTSESSVAVPETASEIKTDLSKGKTDSNEPDSKDVKCESIAEKERDSCEKSSKCLQSEVVCEVQDASATVCDNKCSPSPNNRTRKGRGNRSIAKTPPKSDSKPAARDKLRKRKRVGDESESEGENELTERKQSRSESELSETTSQSEGESKEEQPPTKRRRDKFLKKRKPARQRACDSTSDSEEPEKKPKKINDVIETRNDVSGPKQDEGAMKQNSDLGVGAKESSKNSDALPERNGESSETTDRQKEGEREEKSVTEIAEKDEGGCQDGANRKELSDTKSDCERCDGNKQNNSENYGKLNGLEDVKREGVGKKKRGKRREDHKEMENENGILQAETEAPESKRPCPQSKQGRGRRKKEKVDIPVENLRRSSRANKGQRAIDPGLLLPPESPRKKRAIKPPEETQKQGDEPSGKRGRKSKKEKEEQKKGKKKKWRDTSQDDEEFTIESERKGKRTKGRRGRRGNDAVDSAEDDDDEEDDLAEFLDSLQGDDSEPLNWSSASETEYELDSDGEEYQPSGRNARRQALLLQKQESEILENDDTPCIKCGKYDQPQWILLCDTCEGGYHTGCLRPPLMLIPDGDWFCPTCEHVQLIERLTVRLKELDGQWKKKDALNRRKQRLKYVGICLDNILQDEKPKGRKKKVILSSASEKEETEGGGDGNQSESLDDDDQSHWETLRDKAQKEQENRKANVYNKYYYDWGTKYVDEGSASDSSESESSSSSTEEEYSMVANRSRRQRKEIKYNFDEYDDLIKSAIREDATTEYHPCPRNRGKDISNIEEAYEREKREREEALKKERGDNNDDEAESDGEKGEKGEEEQEEEEEEKEEKDAYYSKPSPVLVKAKKVTRRKGKKLNSLSDDENDDDTDEYRASEDEPSASDNYSEEGTDESLDWAPRGRRRKGHQGATRRSARRRRVLCRMDDFVVDEYDSEEERSHYRRSKRDTRSSAKKYRNYLSETEEEEASEFTEESSEYDSGPPKRRHSRGGGRTKSRSKSSKKTSRHKRSKKKKRKMELSDNSAISDDSEGQGHRKRKSSARYEEDSDWAGTSDGNGPKGRRRAAAKRISYKEPAWSGSDDTNAPKKKKKGKMDVSNFVKSSDDDADDGGGGGSGTDDYFENENGAASGRCSKTSEHSGEESGPVERNCQTKRGDLKSGVAMAETSRKVRRHRRIQKPLSDDSSDDRAPSPSEDKEHVTENVSAGSDAAKTSSVAAVTESATPPGLGNEPVTYTFKAKVSDRPESVVGGSVSGGEGVAAVAAAAVARAVTASEGDAGTPRGGRQDATGDVTGEDGGSEDTDVDVDDLSDIGDIVDYITKE